MDLLFILKALFCFCFSVFLTEFLRSVYQLSWWLWLSCWVKWSQRPDLHFRGKNQKLSAVWPPCRIVSTLSSWSSPHPTVSSLNIWASHTNIRFEIQISHRGQYIPEIYYRFSQPLVIVTININSFYCAAQKQLVLEIHLILNWKWSF